MRMAQFTNFKRNRGPIFKEGNKAYLLRKNIKIIKLNNKLDHTKLGSFKIRKILRLINYKLDLLIKIRIYLSFYILVLEPVNSDTLI